MKTIFKNIVTKNIIEIDITQSEIDNFKEFNMLKLKVHYLSFDKFHELKLKDSDNWIIFDSNTADYDNDTALQILNKEGINYAIQDYCYPNSFIDDKTKELWFEATSAYLILKKYLYNTKTWDIQNDEFLSFWQDIMYDIEKYSKTITDDNTQQLINNILTANNNLFNYLNSENSLKKEQ